MNNQDYIKKLYLHITTEKKYVVFKNKNKSLTKLFAYSLPLDDDEYFKNIKEYKKFIIMMIF